MKIISFELQNMDIYNLAKASKGIITLQFLFKQYFLGVFKILFTKKNIIQKEKLLLQIVFKKKNKKN